MNTSEHGNRAQALTAAAARAVPVVRMNPDARRRCRACPIDRPGPSGRLGRRTGDARARANANPGVPAIPIHAPLRPARVGQAPVRACRACRRSPGVSRPLHVSSTAREPQTTKSFGDRTVRGAGPVSGLPQRGVNGISWLKLAMTIYCHRAAPARIRRACARAAGRRSAGLARRGSAAASGAGAARTGATRTASRTGNASARPARP